MEKPLIVLIDPDTRTVHLYGEHNRTFGLDDMFAIAPFLEDRSVMYVVQAEEYEGEVVLDQIEALAAMPNESSEEEPARKKYIRINKEGYTWLPELKMKFSGPKDAKLIDKVGRDIFVKSPTIRKLLLAGVVELMTEEEANRLRKPRPSPRSHNEPNKMILNRKEDVLENDEMFDNDVAEPDEWESEEDKAIKMLKSLR